MNRARIFALIDALVGTAGLASFVWTGSIMSFAVALFFAWDIAFSAARFGIHPKDVVSRPGDATLAPAQTGAS